MHVAQSVRVEAYLPRDMVEELDEKTDNRSEYIRNAVQEALNND